MKESKRHSIFLALHQSLETVSHSTNSLFLLLLRAVAKRLLISREEQPSVLKTIKFLNALQASASLAQAARYADLVGSENSLNSY